MERTPPQSITDDDGVVAAVRVAAGGERAADGRRDAENGEVVARNRFSPQPFGIARDAEADRRRRLGDDAGEDRVERTDIGEVGVRQREVVRPVREGGVDARQVPGVTDRRRLQEQPLDE